MPRRPNFALIRYNWRENSILLARVKTSQTWRCCGASSRRRSPPPSSQLQAGVGRLSGWRGLQNVNEMLKMMETRMVLHFVIKSVPESGSEWKWAREVGIVWYPCYLWSKSGRCIFLSFVCFVLSRVLNFSIHNLVNQYCLTQAFVFVLWRFHVMCSL